MITFLTDVKHFWQQRTSEKQEMTMQVCGYAAQDAKAPLLRTHLKDGNLKIMMSQLTLNTVVFAIQTYIK
jgi:hypothetical protein